MRSERHKALISHWGAKGGMIKWLRYGSAEMSRMGKLGAAKRYGKKEDK